MENNIVQTWCE